jgi:hypothetical protein
MLTHYAFSSEGKSFILLKDMIKGECEYQKSL